jgi:predicted GIY-YIG superfamily endonuclease
LVSEGTRSSRAERSAVEGSRGETEKLPMNAQNYFVYMLTNPDRHTVLYIGVTNDLERRANEHSLGSGSYFAKQYNAHKLVYFEAFPDPESAIAREKQLKNWSRRKKEELIARSNPDSRDLFNEMYAVKS